jgi:hypothetical protein
MAQKYRNTAITIPTNIANTIIDITIHMAGARQANSIVPIVVNILLLLSFGVFFRILFGAFLIVARLFKISFEALGT